MSVTRGDPITQADWDALADLANSKIGPLAPSDSNIRWNYLPDGYQFSFFDETILPPTDVIGTPVAGGGYYDPPTWTTTIIIRIYSFKEVSGRRHYSTQYATGVSTVDAINGAIDWAWTAPVDDADGYIVVTGNQGSKWPVVSGLFAIWREESGVSFSDDGETGWLDPNVLNVIGDFLNLNPVTYHTWLNMLSYIRQDVLYLASQGMPIDYNACLVSGPWCCAVGPVLRGGDLWPDRFKEIEFYCAADDHSGDVELKTQFEIGETLRPATVGDALYSGTPHATGRFDFAYTTATGGTLTGKVQFYQTGSGSGWTHLVSVVSGSITLDFESWTELDSRTLQLEFSFTIPAGSSSFKIDITTAAGNLTSQDNLSPKGFANVATTLEIDSVELTPEAATIVHPNSAGEKIEIFGNYDPDTAAILFNGVAYQFSLATGLNGVWVSKTLPVFGVHTYLENDLPNYPQEESDLAFDITLGSPRAKSPVSSPTINPTEPAVRARSSLWPVFRDTEFLQWKFFAGRVAPVPYYPGFNQFLTVATVSLNPGEVWSNTSTRPSNTTLVRVEAFETTLPIYFSATAPTNPLNPADYSGSVPSPLLIPADFAPAFGDVFFYAVENNTAAPVTFTVRIWRFYEGTSYDPGDAPEFFLRTGNGSGGFEKYSYNLYEDYYLRTNVREIPLLGYCISEIKIVRSAVDGVIPSTGTTALDVKIGFMRGTTSETPGTFEEIETMTIQVDESSVTEEKFWPVIEGTPICYQCDEAVEIYAAVNFQPLVLVDFYGAPQFLEQRLAGTYSGLPELNDTEGPLRFRNVTLRNGPDEQWITWPVCATVFNDLETVLDLI